MAFRVGSSAAIVSVMRVTSTDRLENDVAEIISTYRTLLEASASPLTATPERWEQCRSQAEGILAECFSRVDGPVPQGSDAVQRTVELGALRAAERIPGTESVRAALLLWQATVQTLRRILPADLGEDPDGCPSLFTAMDTLAQALIGRLLHGAVGYYDPEIVQAIAASSELAHSPGAASADPEPGPDGAIIPLTAREQQILAYVAEAMTNHAIGRELGIAESTVKRHLRNIFAKLGASSRMDATQKAGLSLQLRPRP